MKRFTAVMRTVLAVAFGLLLALPAARAWDIDRAFTQFEEPSSNRVRGRCKTPEIIAHRNELAAAVGLLGRKIERMERAEADAVTSLESATDAQQPGIRRDIIDLNRWQEHWRRYKAALEGQIAFYNSLPDCPSRARPTAVWVDAPVPPISNSRGRTPGCVTPKGAAEAAPFIEANGALMTEHAALDATISELLAELGALTAQGLGGGVSAEDLRRRIKEAFARMAAIEVEMAENNLAIGRIEQQNPCPPPPPEGSSVTPPPGDTRQAAATLGTFETGVLAVLNGARSDPAAYAEGLRGARGQAAAEAREFLGAKAALTPLSLDAQLTAAALAHAQDLARRDVVSHAGADGSGLLTRFRGQGLHVTLAAEVISTGQTTPAGVIRQLVIDEGHPGGPHRKDLFNGVFTRVGVASAATRSHGRIVVVTLSNEPVKRDD